MKRKTLLIIVAAFIVCGATAFPIDVVITNVFPRVYMNLLFAVELGVYLGVGALLLSNLVMRQKFADVGYILAGLIGGGSALFGEVTLMFGLACATGGGRA